MIPRRVHSVSLQYCNTHCQIEQHQNDLNVVTGFDSSFIEWGYHIYTRWKQLVMPIVQCLRVCPCMVHNYMQRFHARLETWKTRKSPMVQSPQRHNTENKHAMPNLRSQRCLKFWTSPMLHWHSGLCGEACCPKWIVRCHTRLYTCTTNVSMHTAFAQFLNALTHWMHY